MAKSPIADKGLFAQISTFGASPVSMAASVATLKVLEEEKLLFNAQMMGKALREGLEALQRRFPAVGDVRGMGLMQGIELVKDRRTKEPDPAATNRLMESSRRHGLLIGKGGLYGNALRIAPPMVVNRPQIDDALHILAEAMAEAFR